MSTEKIKWGFSTIGCPDWSLKEAADFGLNNGYPLLEVRISGKDFAERDLLSQLGEEKRCFLLGTSFGLITDSPDYRQMLADCANLAAECNIPYVRVFGGCGFSEQLDDNKIDCAKRNLDFFAKLDLPVQLLLETHDLFSSAERVSYLFSKLGCSLPVIWDTYHTYFTGKETLPRSWELLKEHIIDVHVKDGSPETGLTLAGAGKFPLADLFKLLKEENYSGMVTCEHEKMWHKELPELPEAFRALDAFKPILTD